MNKPDQVSKRRRFRVLVGYLRMYARVDELYFNEVWAYNADEALAMFDRIVMYRGKPLVEEITT